MNTAPAKFCWLAFGVATAVGEFVPFKNVMKQI